MSFCVDHNILLVSSDCVWDKIAAKFQTELWKKNTKALEKEINLKTSVKWQPHCLGLKVLKHRGQI